MYFDGCLLSLRSFAVTHRGSSSREERILFFCLGWFGAWWVFFSVTFKYGSCEKFTCRYSKRVFLTYVFYSSISSWHHHGYALLRVLVNFLNWINLFHFPFLSPRAYCFSLFSVPPVYSCLLLGFPLPTSLGSRLLDCAGCADCDSS
jgi:hypothetical protein